MKTIAAVMMTALAMGSMSARAAEYGIGVSVQSDDSILYLPVELSDSFRLEPSIRYAKTEFEDFFGGEIEREQLEFGIGLFGLSAVSKSIRLYYGGRVSYIDLENTNPVLAFPAGSGDGNLVRTTANDSDGYRIAPTIGFEFLFNERLSLGGEAAYLFQEVDGDGVDMETRATATRLILRFTF